MSASRRLYWQSTILYLLALALPVCRVDAPLSGEAAQTLFGFDALIRTVMACFWESHFAAFFAANVLYAFGMHMLWREDRLSAFGLCFLGFVIAAAGMLAFARADRCLSIELGCYAWLSALALPGFGSLWLPAAPRRGRRRQLPTFD